MSYKDLPQNILFGFSTTSDWAFTQSMTDKGGLGANQISSASWGGEWPTLTTFTTHDKHGNSLTYVLGSGNKKKEIFIQHISAIGAIGAETYRKEADFKYESCCSYNIGEKTYIFLQSKTDNKWSIRPVSFDGKLENSIQNSKWNTYYEILFTVVVSNVTYLVGHSSDGNRFFIQAVNSDGTLGLEKTNTKWSRYYDTLIPIKVNEATFLWGQNKSSKNWFTQEIIAGGTLAKNEADSGTWKYYYSSATSYVGTVNNINTAYLFAQTTSDSNKWFTQKIDKDGKIANEETSSGSFLYFYSFLSIIKQPVREPKNAWMAKALPLISDKKLNQIIIPGSHDAGMYKTTVCTASGGPSNTVTQGCSVYDQLLQGARYFDLRVAAQYIDGGDVKYKTVHVSNIEIFNLGYQGCLGPSMDEILNDVAQYADDSAHKSELVILKFSHFLNCCWPGFADGWNVERQEHFVEYIIKKLGRYMVRYSGMNRIGQLSYGEILSHGTENTAKILVVIDGLDQSLRNTTLGIFKYKNYDPTKPIENFTNQSADLYVYDRYSSTSDVDIMINNQHEKYLNKDNHGGDMYLLSWTLTQDSLLSLSVSIDSMAHTANSRLPTSLHDWYAAKEITSAQMPNILYVDYLNELEAEVSHTLMEMIYKK